MVGIGAGQQSRVDCVKLEARKVFWTALSLFKSYSLASITRSKTGGTRRLLV